MSYWTDAEYEAEARVVLLNREDNKRSLRKCVSEHIATFFTDVPPELVPQKRHLLNAVFREAARP